MIERNVGFFFKKRVLPRSLRFLIIIISGQVNYQIYYFIISLLKNTIFLLTLITSLCNFNKSSILSVPVIHLSTRMIMKKKKVQHDQSIQHSIER